jgi:predicted DNA-binding transcriptional regulator AlpA
LGTGAKPAAAAERCAERYETGTHRRLPKSRGHFRGIALLIGRGSMSAREKETIFLRPAEVAALAGLSTRAIYRAVERGELPQSVCAHACAFRELRSRIGSTRTGSIRP